MSLAHKHHIRFVGNWRHLTSIQDVKVFGLTEHTMPSPQSTSKQGIHWTKPHDDFFQSLVVLECFWNVVCCILSHLLFPVFHSYEIAGWRLFINYEGLHILYLFTQVFRFTWNCNGHVDWHYSLQTLHILDCLYRSRLILAEVQTPLLDLSPTALSLEGFYRGISKTVTFSLNNLSLLETEFRWFQVSSFCSCNEKPYVYIT